MLIVLYWNIKEYMVKLSVEKRMKQVRESLQYQSIVWRRIWTIIGTEGEPWARKENVFDNNILTGFSASSPDGNWVGLELKRAMKVSKIKYIGRNDGNGIETGDEYELYYWNSKGFWDDLGKKKATDNVLLFHKIPTNGLYVLKDLTKGKEERIFTYEEGKQVWW